MTGWHIHHAEMVGAKIQLTLRNAQGEERVHLTEHVIAGTGFQYDLRRLRFVASSLLDAVKTQISGAPVLSRNFESSVSGMYFVGPASAPSFGPLLRFVAGAEYAAVRLTTHLTRRRNGVRVDGFVVAARGETR